jgi:hypothetical protein
VKDSAVTVKLIIARMVAILYVGLFWCVARTSCQQGWSFSPKLPVCQMMEPATISRIMMA